MERTDPFILLRYVLNAGRMQMVSLCVRNFSAAELITVDPSITESRSRCFARNCTVFIRGHLRSINKVMEKNILRQWKNICDKAKKLIIH